MNFRNVGFLGGGQLAYMAAPYAEKLGINLYSLDKAGAPAESILKHFVPGSIQSFDDIVQFGKTLDLISIEVESINVDALAELEKSGVPVRPSSEVIRLIQDKGTQKQFFADNSIPTSPFRLIHSKKDLPKHVDFLPAFQKLRKGGYDGKGVQSIHSESDFHKAFTAPSVLEKTVSIDKEIAIIVVRNSQGDIVVYPPVEMIFDEKLNLIDFLFCPADITNVQAERAIEISKSVAEKLCVIGLLAVELFIDESGEILVNELAPRTHNSGHHTIESASISQFEMHLRAIAELPLSPPKIERPALMMNLLGTDGHTGTAYLEGKEKADSIDNVYLHWYGKKETKPGRKMGHVTITDRSREEAIALAKNIRSWLRVISK